MIIHKKECLAKEYQLVPSFKHYQEEKKKYMNKIHIIILLCFLVSITI